MSTFLTKLYRHAAYHGSDTETGRVLLEAARQIRNLEKNLTALEERAPCSRADNLLAELANELRRETENTRAKLVPAGSGLNRIADCIDRVLVRNNL